MIQSGTFIPSTYILNALFLYSTAACCVYKCERKRNEQEGNTEELDPQLIKLLLNGFHLATEEEGTYRGKSVVICLICLMRSIVKFTLVETHPVFVNLLPHPHHFLF